MPAEFICHIPPEVECTPGVFKALRYEYSLELSNGIVIPQTTGVKISRSMAQRSPDCYQWVRVNEDRTVYQSMDPEFYNNLRAELWLARLRERRTGGETAGIETAYDIELNAGPLPSVNGLYQFAMAGRPMRKDITSPIKGFTAQALSKGRSRFVFLFDQGKPIAYLELEAHNSSLSAPNSYTPHIKVEKEYRNRGIATVLYTWALKSGVILMTDGSHTFEAHKLWNKLAKTFQSYLIDSIGKTVAKDWKGSLAGTPGVERVILGKGRKLQEIKIKRRS